MNPSALLLTGPPGIGKTTVMRRVADGLGGIPAQGFVTEEIREQGRRVGFRIVTLDGHGAILAHIDIDSRHRVGRYGVDVKTLDAVVEACLVDVRHDAVVLIDEIGKMECFSTRFVDTVRSLLRTRQPLVATVALRGRGLIEEVKSHSGALVIQITRCNRDRQPDRVLEWLRRHARGDSQG